MCDRTLMLRITKCVDCSQYRRRGWFNIFPDGRHVKGLDMEMGHFGSGCAERDRGIDDGRAGIPDWCPLLKEAGDDDTA